MLTELLKMDPYVLQKSAKREIMESLLNELTVFHRAHCLEYDRMLCVMGHQIDLKYNLEELPFFPIRLFKEQDFLSVPRSKIIKTMTSSGTSGQSVSKIYLNDETSRNQTRVLAHIIGSFIGNKRLPMVILDTELVKKDRAIFSARGAGIVGFSMFGRDVLFALDDKMNLRLDALNEFVEKYHGIPIVLFGYTYMIWKYVIKVLQKAKINLQIFNGTLFHVGGWKKIESEHINTEAYNQCVKETMGNVKVHNYYGMAEQLGSVFVECEYGLKHCSIFSDILIRRTADFSCAFPGERGIIELMSVLPTSYPGHILLTEDEGEIIGEDDCPCGRLGKTFKIHGRIKNAEIRGCSDTYEKRI